MEIPREKREKVRALFDSALQHESTARSSFLMHACPDEDVRALVEELLRSYEQAGSFLSHPPINTDRLASFGAEAFKPGELLAGRFRITRFIARGGVGEVYEAEDQELRQQVAIKTIRQDVLEQPHIVERFKREVCLARVVTHPNVCRIFDLFRHQSSSLAGQDIMFVSMELLRGETLYSRLRRVKALSTVEALPIIDQMGAALDAAHTVGIVHRDFKPGNVVLVSSDRSSEARAVVTDFGMAFRYTEDFSLGLTPASRIIGTPEWMSPEQVEGRELTAASDIYSLGLVMYQMITGIHPFEAESPVSCALRRLREEPPSPCKIVPSLPQRWEAVILQCLDRDPARRFAKASEVADALTDESVRLRQKLSKKTRLIRRGAILSLLVILGVLVIIWLHRDQRGIETHLKIQKERTCKNGEVHAAIDVRKLELTYQAKSFETTLGGLEGLASKATMNFRTLLAAKVATEQWNQLLDGLAVAYNSCDISRDQYNYALTQIYPRLSKDAADLEDIRKAMVKGQKTDPQLQLVLERYFYNLRHFADAGNSKVVEATSAVVQQTEEDRLAALQSNFDKLNQKVVELQKEIDRLPKPGIVTSELKRELIERADEAENEYKQGYELVQKYQFRGAIVHLKKAVEAVPLPAFYLTLGTTLRDIPDLPEAERVVREGLKHANGKPEYQASLNGELGLILKARGDLPAAQRYMERALAIHEKIYGPDHLQVASDATALGAILQDEGNLPAAQKYAERALALAEKLKGPEDPEVAIQSSNLSLILKDQGQLRDAQRYAERALAISEKIYVSDNPSLAVQNNNLAHVLIDEGMLPDAQRYAERALAIGERVYGPDHPAVAIYVNNVSVILHGKGDLPAAREYAQRALEIDEKAYGTVHPKVAIRLSNLGTILRDQGDLVGAQTCTERALAIDLKVYGSDHPDVATRLSILGSISLARGDLPAAQRYVERALAIDEKVFGPLHPNVALDANDMGKILKERGDPKKAQRYTDRALAIDLRVYGPDHFRTKAVAANLASINKLLQDRDVQAEKNTILQKKR